MWTWNCCKSDLRPADVPKLPREVFAWIVWPWLTTLNGSGCHDTAGGSISAWTAASQIDRRLLAADRASRIGSVCAPILRIGIAPVRAFGPNEASGCGKQRARPEAGQTVLLRENAMFIAFSRPPHALAIEKYNKTAPNAQRSSARQGAQLVRDLCSTPGGTPRNPD